MAGGGPSGSTIRFINRGTFWVALIVRNNSAKPVTLIGARTPEPLDSLVRQTRAGFSRHMPCTSRGLCPPPAIRPTSTKPLTLPPHAQAAVKLNYQLVSCAKAKASTTASASSLVLNYRYGAVSIAQETVPLGYGRLHLERPAGIECLPRPYSYIGLVGSFTTSPEHRPIPGSDGDTCTKTAAGGLTFRSREFTERMGTAFVVEIKSAALPRHRQLPHRRADARPCDRDCNRRVRNTRTHDGFPRPNRHRDRHDRARHDTRRPPHGRLLGHRRFFRAYGAWRCTVLG